MIKSFARRVIAVFNQKPVAILVLVVLVLGFGTLIVKAALTMSASSVTSDTSLSLTAGGTNQNVVMTPSGTGHSVLNGSVGIGTTTPTTFFTIASSSSNYFNVTAAGLVGIGTTTPANPLTVIGATNITGALTVASCSGCGVGSAGGSNTQIQYNNGNTISGDANFTWASSTQLLTLTGTSTISGLAIATTTFPTNALFTVGSSTANSLFNVLKSGNVGIGSSAPARRLEVVDDSDGTNARIRVGTTNASGLSGYEFYSGSTWKGAFIRNNTTDDLSIWTADSANTPKLTILNTSGKVGIGTATPTTTLEVAKSAATTTISIGSGSGTNRGQMCLWNGASWTTVSFAANSVTPIYATSTVCSEN